MLPPDELKAFCRFSNYCWMAGPVGGRIMLEAFPKLEDPPKNGVLLLISLSSNIQQDPPSEVEEPT